jgi:electron transfer flavoprotein alpha subunit
VTVFCLVEPDGGTVADASLRALTLARGLAAGAATEVAAVLFGAPDAALVSALAEYGVGDVYVASGIDCYAPQAWARILAELLGAASLSADAPVPAVVAAGTEHGNEVMAHLGAITGLPMAANCVVASPSDAGVLNIVRQRWAGLLLEEAVLDAPAALLTVATDAVSAEPAPAPGEAVVHEVSTSAGDADLVVRAAESSAGAGGASLATARVVVGGGRGVGSADGFAPLEELAGLLGGVVGVSRVVTSEGWRPHSMQVGQTGTKITPDLYLACGISGAIQHFAGCSGAKHIIAINTDPSAPMMTRADYAVVGDLHEVLPALIKALRSRVLPERVGDNRGMRFFRVKVVRTLPHPGRGFTQGLITEGETVWESVGQYGMSVLRRYEFGAAEVAAQAAVPPEFFAEAICRVGASIVQLTWRERVALRWNAATLEVAEKVRFNREGWGICAVPADNRTGAGPDAADIPVSEVVTSDGSSELVRRDPVTLAPRAVVHVRCGESRVRWLNDLTWADGLVWANVLGTACLAGIDLDTGAVTDLVDARAAGEWHADPQMVMNGIAALGRPGEFLLTGKGWRSIRHVRLIPDRGRGQVDRLLEGPRRLISGI